MERVLVTGAHGLLGNNLVRQLIEDYEVYAVVRKNKISRHSSVGIIELDLSGNWSSTSLPKKIDRIVHLAQSSNYRDFPNSALDIFNVNVASTAKLLEYSRSAGAKQFIYASSGGVYGNKSFPITENCSIEAPTKLGYYLGSKASSEILVQSYSKEMFIGIIRPFFMYGIGQKRNMLLPRLYDCIENGEKIYLQGKDGIKINPIHVLDAVSAVRAMLTFDGQQIYNIAGPKIYSIREICENIADYIGNEVIFELNEEEPYDLIGDITNMNTALYSPKRELTDHIIDLKNDI